MKIILRETDQYCYISFKLLNTCFKYMFVNKSAGQIKRELCKNLKRDFMMIEVVVMEMVKAGGGAVSDGNTLQGFEMSESITAK